MDVVPDNLKLLFKHGRSDIFLSCVKSLQVYRAG